MKHICCISIVSLVLTGVLFGIDVSIDYIEGNLAYQMGNKSKWVDLEIGSKLPSGSSVRLSGNGYAELSSGQEKITLTKDGVYMTKSLFRTNREKSNLRSLLGKKFSSLIKRSDSSNYTAAAVRGSSRNTNSVSWEDESADPLNAGIKQYNAGNYVSARNHFKESSLWEEGAVKRESIFRLALSEKMLGNPRESRRVIASLKPQKSDNFFEEYSIYSGTLYLESQEYDMAGKILKSYLETSPARDGKQAALFLMAYVHEGQGNKAAKMAALRQIVELGSETDLGKSASQIL